PQRGPGGEIERARTYARVIGVTRMMAYAAVAVGAAAPACDDDHMDPARLSRLRLVLAHAQLRPVDDPDPHLSYSNDTWAFTDERWGRCILRVCYRGDVRRLSREALLCRELGRTVRVPSVLAVGEVDAPRERETLGGVAAAGAAETLTWTVTSR